MPRFLHVSEPPIEWNPTKHRYVEIADHIESQIRSGALQPRAALPSVPRMAEQYGVAKMTITRAVRVLVQRDLVVIVHGRGTFVREPDDVPDDQS